MKIYGITGTEDVARPSVWGPGHSASSLAGTRAPALSEEAELIGAELHRRTVLTGVFVNATLDEVAELADRCHLGLLQLHGDEGPAYCREAARRTGCKVMKAARVRDAAQVQALRAFATNLHLLDATRRARQAAPGRARLGARPSALGTPPVVLSGGLTPDNVGRAIEQARPLAVDTASGTEAEPGRKDHAKLEAFFQRSRRPTPRSSRRHERPGSRGASVRTAAATYRRRSSRPWTSSDGLARGARRPAYGDELDALLRDYVGRPTPLYHAARLSELTGGQVWLKREDLTHTGSHKINNALGQALLAAAWASRG